MVDLFREKYYAGIKDDPQLHVKLTGSWETVVGQQDTFGMFFQGHHRLIVLMLRATSSSYTRIRELRRLWQDHCTYKNVRCMSLLILSMHRLIGYLLARQSVQGAPTLRYLTVISAHARVCFLSHCTTPRPRRHLRASELPVKTRNTTWVGKCMVRFNFFWKSCSYRSLCRRRGIEARRKFVAPIGAWFSQVGRLHQVNHMWQYPFVHQ